ncbi:MAG TPA: regulatory iron-sulfur-containing complex subunit RicT [Roseiflexaceae bacterium]|nr:regulatory iron-sulfur-containing complex subunit RicT [Roseiflexaceae bacterium]
MPVVVGIRFKDSGKTYFFDPNGVEMLSQGDSVIVETVRGLELAKIAREPHSVAENEVVGELKPVIRRAEAADFERMRLLSARHDEVLERCAEKILEHGLPMRLVKAEYSFDGSRLTFYFTSEKRVDFRMLVRDLARTFKTRIELRQIGPRDEAKLLGGIGPCGRLLCCATFLPDYARVSIKMAKDQDLPLNPTKISGVCGRLLCCLSYEHEQYLEIKAELPRRGAWVQTPDGPGEVVMVNVVRETVVVELAGSGVHEEFSPAQISEATQRVGTVARGRAEEGITPLAGGLERPERRELPPRREPKHTGERRLLRDEIDDPDVLDALALLEEGIEERSTPRLEEPRNREARAERSPDAIESRPLILPDLSLDELEDQPQRPSDTRRAPGIPPRRSPQPERPAQTHRPHRHPHQSPSGPSQSEPSEPAPGQQRPNEPPRMPRHRRKRHGGRGER